MAFKTVSALFLVTAATASPCLAFGKSKPTPPPPPKPALTLEQGIYHDPTAVDPSTCSRELSYSPDGESVFITYVTNYQSAFSCIYQNVYHRYGLTLTPGNEWKYLNENGDELKQVTGTEFELSSSPDNTGDYVKVSGQQARPKTFRVTGWSNWNWTRPDQLCALNSGPTPLCSTISAAIVKENGNCENAKKSATDFVMNACRKADYANCLLTDVKVRIFLNTQAQDGSFLFSGCAVDATAEGQEASE